MRARDTTIFGNNYRPKCKISKFVPGYAWQRTSKRAENWSNLSPVRPTSESLTAVHYYFMQSVLLIRFLTLGFLKVAVFPNKRAPIPLAYLINLPRTHYNIYKLELSSACCLLVLLMLQCYNPYYFKEKAMLTTTQSTELQVL